MSTARLHPSLPAPVVHAGFSVSQSKSHVLAGVQDAYWSDDEAEDAECPLCLEEMDISDLNFKPCVCGYQICRFCWHHIKENLNKRCPACRRVYTDEGVEFKPINTQDHKRLMQQKKQRDRERKELDALGRRQLANVRVVQRNVVYVVGIGPRFGKEELIPTLRSNEYFGQYGKITKIILVKRTPSGGGAPVVGLYITYHRKEDAARAMSAVDGIASPSGGKEVMRASYGTTKYCMAFLRGVSCTDQNCMNLHEWGDEKDCFTKEDLTTLKHTMKATETRTRMTVVKRSDEPEGGLPRAASWAQKPVTTYISGLASSASASSLARPTRRGGAPRQVRPTTNAQEIRTPTRPVVERKSAGTPISHTSASRPSTPGSVSEAKASRKELLIPKSTSSPTPSVTADSDTGTSMHEQQPSSRPSSPVASQPTQLIQSTLPSVPPATISLPAIPPGLSAPPGIPSPSRPPRVATASPQTPLLSSQSSYQMSTAARALLDDVKARREAPLPAFGYSPFPDFDRTLQTLSGGDGGGFSFNLDPKLADAVDAELSTDTAFNNPYIDTFSGLRNPAASTISTPDMAPPGLSFPANRSLYDQYTNKPDLGRQSPHSYVGSFNPFADSLEDNGPSRSPADTDDERKHSRFNFARRQNMSNLASPSRASPSRVPVPGVLNNRDQHSFYPPSPATQHHWSPLSRPEYTFSQPVSAIGSPLLHQNQPQPSFPPTSQAFQTTFEAELSEAQLREFIQSSRERASTNNIYTNNQGPPGLNKSQQPFYDPAIMSASFAPASQVPLNNMAYGPPPGLSFPSGLNAESIMVNSHVSPIPTLNEEATHVSTTNSPPPIALSPTDFPALAANNIDTYITRQDDDPSASETKTKSQERAERKAEKQAAAAERAAERQRLAQEKAAVKAVEKAELARKKAEEKERLSQQQAAEAERKKLEFEWRKAEERAAKLERENIARAEHEAIEKVRLEKEKEKAARAEKEKIAALKKIQKQLESSKIVSKTKDPVPNQQHTKPTVEDFAQVPLLSKKPKKTKPVAKPLRIPKEEEHLHDETSTLLSAVTSEAPRLPGQTSNSSRVNSRSHSVERQSNRTTVHDFFEQINIMRPQMDLASHPFFDLYKVASASKMPLEYGPLVHALSALSVGGASFSNNMPTNSIDNAVSSFQQLLETLTQTISDLLRLLPRTTWDDSSSFDGVLRDMLKSDDFLDDAGEESATKEDEVAALTLALERRARWMEVQLSKLEELHRDINTAAVRAILAFNDNGWDKSGFLPRVTNTLRRFEQIGIVDEEGRTRPMTVDELEKKLVVSKEATVFAETEVREMMEKFQGIKFDSYY